ncbi:hypothetical protein ONE63_003116 [Megalurothrips usitatus]|uniref:DUF7153 domain-containing protein n=1 Tax=Megalurothrips usitatus TaxID=439358 RepID=A0AAV7X995_9NEOP|nr:hypothetical protein ONE63_003116 [Megalurothrips usitatus]
MHRAGFSNGAGSGGSSAGSSSPCSSLASSPGPGQPPGTPGTPTPHGSLAIFSFALPSRQAKLAYKEQQLAIRGALEATAGMDAKQGATLATLEKGVLFPVVHVCDSGALFRRYLDTGRMLAEDAMGPDFALYQACYQEVRCIVPEGAELATPPFDQPDGPRDFLLLGFKSVEESFRQVLEDTWKDWTGARHIYLFLPDVLGLERISLYRLVEPDHMHLFKYLVLARLGPAACAGSEGASKAQDLLLDYVQRLRVRRITAYLSVYRSLT